MCASLSTRKNECRFLVLGMQTVLGGTLEFFAGSWRVAGITSKELISGVEGSPGLRVPAVLHLCFSSHAKRSVCVQLSVSVFFLGYPLRSVIRVQIHGAVLIVSLVRGRGSRLTVTGFLCQRTENREPCSQCVRRSLSLSLSFYEPSFIHYVPCGGVGVMS